MIKNKRFAFACWAVFCVSAVTVVMKFDADAYKIMILAVIGGYLSLQTYHDAKKLKNGDK